jgi:hypothetical protein
MAKKRMGRPPLSDEQRKTRIVQFRCRDELYELLGQAAAEGGRSIAGEIEHRLSESFGISQGPPNPSEVLLRLEEFQKALVKFQNAHRALQKTVKQNKEDPS